MASRLANSTCRRIASACRYRTASRFGELDALRAARDQWPLQLELQASEMMADRGLRDVQLIRGAREAAGLDDSDEVAKLAQVHGRLPAG